ncbi:MAG TPA: T9SS type A sorting domain-containing protein [candidate division Zixibacteria bacterium]|nr:T9SS type A sorting domain-containing protein [candidate division Zixibacteria bacterium]
MKRAIAGILFIFVALAGADQITGSCDNYQFLDIVVLSPKVCDERVYDVLLFSGNFTLSPPEGCSFCADPPVEYYVSIAHDDDGDTIQDPGEAVCLYGPFYVDESCNHYCGDTLHKITEGGFEGYIYNATKMIPIDSIKINIYHHYVGSSVDTFEYEATYPLMNLTDLGGGTYHYQMTGIPSGGKKVEFFCDSNGNDTLDPGELATMIDREIPIVGNQYDDSVNIDLSTLRVKESVPLPNRKIMASPNPFNSAVKIVCVGVNSGDHIVIRDIEGRVINRFSAAGVVVWRGNDLNGNSVPSGIYFATIEEDTRTITKIWLIR